MATACSIEPFRYQSTPQPEAEEGSSSNQINEQALEDYIARLIGALCTDLVAIEMRLDEIETRLTALETP